MRLRCPTHFSQRRADFLFLHSPPKITPPIFFLLDFDLALSTWSMGMSHRRRLIGGRHTDTFASRSNLRLRTHAPATRFAKADQRPFRLLQAEGREDRNGRLASGRKEPQRLDLYSLATSRGRGTPGPLFTACGSTCSCLRCDVRRAEQQPGFWFVLG